MEHTWKHSDRETPELLGEKPVAMLHFPPQVLLGLAFFKTGLLP
jgi:hypothetical protein